MHLNAATGAVTTRARLRVRNGGAAPLAHVALQVSSTLLWQSVRLLEANGAGTRLPVEQYRVTTDTDHTGAANELVLTLTKPLAPGAEASLDLYYGGTLRASAERLLRLGAPAERAAEADWDGVSGRRVGLRGFGNVLWFPVSAPAALLADGDGFARAVNGERERTSETTLQLSLKLEQVGGALTTAWFLDQPAPLRSALQRREPVEAADVGAASTSSSTGVDGYPAEDTEQTEVTTAEWPAVRLDGRPISLFAANGSPLPEAPIDAGAQAVRVVGTDRADATAQRTYADAAAKSGALLARWLPARRSGTLTVLPLPSPAMQPFADGGLLVTPLRAAGPDELAEALVYPLVSAALPQDAPPWVREGVPEFLRLLYVEQTTGHDRMMAELNALSGPLQQVEGARGMDPLPLRRCVDPVCARNKAAYALLMLRALVDDAALQQALHAMLLGADRATGADEEAGRGMTQRFEAALGQSSGKDLRWFFADWFNADRGLPELEIVQVAPRRVERGAHTVTEPTVLGPVPGPIGAEPQAPADDPRRNSPTAASRNTVGLPDGSWLVAVEVQNNGDAAAEVPVTVRGAALQNQLPLRVPAHGRATIRVPFEAAPEEVLVNDGTVPEQRGTVHRRTIQISSAPR